MASWLKVAEDLLEVVDRRAKLVVSELADEQQDSQPPPASNGEEVQARKTKSKDHSRPSTEPPKTSDTERGQTSTQASASNVTADKNVDPPSENAGAMPSNLAQASTDPPSDVNKDTAVSSLSLSETLPNEVSKHEADIPMEVSATDNDDEAVTTSINGDVAIEKTNDRPERSSSSPSANLVKSVNGHHPIPSDGDPKVELADEDFSLKIDPERSESRMVEIETHSHGDLKGKDVEALQEPPPNLKKLEEHKTDTSPMRMLDQLDEAQGLLKSAISTGQSKEARLARVCAGLSSRLQEYKSENAQLEELLVAERERSNSYEARIKQLQQDLSISKTAVIKVESDMADTLAVKNSEIEALVSSLDALKKQAAVSEGNLSSLQANMESIMRSRELTETRMMQALREELSAADRRAEEERAAHNATKMAAMERQVELEHRAVEASTALARVQRTMDERTLKVTELEQKLALLEVECASLNQELHDMEARARRGQKRSPEEANQSLQMQAWQEEVERARLGQRDAESKLSSLEAEVQKIRVEMAGMKRDAEHYSRQEHMELEKRYRELTDLLYHKQTQLEAMASEKAAAEFQLEKETKRLQEVEAESSRVSRRSSSYWEEDTDLKALEPLPLHHRHIAGARMQLQRAAKLLDSGAVRATRFLWQYPIARMILLFYLVFVHLFLMYLLHRLQEQADNFASKELAASMGLGESKLP
ncbi:golgin candidate 1-like [Magnolia sinica]|uniref:golgin candidate 1-like n=1 Tax=Magnolia sinica TaxID=86752 RepID=UPI002659EBD8|nr:golgin candidate 1-like [Magnolia sinica]